MKTDKPIVSVCMITYNHEKYITQAIESIVSQKCNFPIELIIGEDCSTDDTRRICIEYQDKYPQIIRLLLPDSNLGVMGNFTETIMESKGKYIALCEGDDYWTDELKLQKQIDFLEANQIYVISYHNSMILKGDQFYGKVLTETGNLSPDDIFLGKIIPTQTVVFRNLKKELPESFKRVFNGDTYLFCWLANQTNKGAYFHSDIKDSVYRHHDGGVWSKTSLHQKYNRSLNTMTVLFEEFPVYRYSIKKRLIQMFEQYCGHNISVVGKIVYFFKIQVFMLRSLQLGFAFLLLKKKVKMLYLRKNDCKYRHRI
ncbi:glycosyltransferase [Parabacteroides sp. FAFU027]|uniref:glycosyltransferase n=1 Tax=Parabacteroides sp. FAFU027 TaxID=2922715 RepID=UPI001FAEF843|nr:glycosyltransferase family 2 protein [Parabacteroides sp. FAFU027]